eukprot:TRINITY_DN153_c0_g1_i1.p1 TRINITY_DN153_c0_g1~~TRINITY_DN153_c0_g1_i1.p1  ORF type:complete len:122 (-),score=20.19 TRINITY_DN153_c0_g1_i1:52-417(-)
MVKAFELRTKSKEDLNKQLDELRKELSNLRVAKVTGGAANKVSKIRVVRKDIARVLTVLNQNQKHQLRKFFANHKFKPLDLRQKKTRAIRRRLSPSERNAQTIRQRKQAIHNPKRKFAVRV